MKKSSQALAAVVLVIGILTVLISQKDPVQDKGANAEKAVTQQQPAPQVAGPAVANGTQGTQKASDSPLTRPEAIRAYSDYVMQLQAHIYSASMMMQFESNKIQQAISFQNPDAYRESAEELEDILRKAQYEVGKISYPNNLSDPDAAVFDDAQNAAFDVIAQYLSTAADIGVNAHTGMDMSGDLNKDISLSQKTQDQFRTIVLNGYKHFAVKRSSINMDTLTLKDSS